VGLYDRAAVRRHGHRQGTPYARLQGVDYRRSGAINSSSVYRRLPDDFRAADWPG
jgi:hypothetical protein